MRNIAVVAVAFTVLLGLCAAVEEEEKSTPEVKLFGGYVTRTRFKVLTSTTLLSCVSTLAGGAVCQGRRKRSASTIDKMTLDELKSNPVELEDSEGEHKIFKRDAAPASFEDSKTEKGRLFVSLTTFTTMTTTSFTANTATTVSVSFHCTPPEGVNIPACS